MLAEIAPATTPRAVELCDWLDGHSLADGGLPFALPISSPAGCAPWWRDPDTNTSSLQMTAQVAATAHLVAGTMPASATTPWLARATTWCLDAIAGLDREPHAYALLFAIRFLDAISNVDGHAVALLDGLARYLPPDGVVRVQGGAEDESLRPLDFAPRPDSRRAGSSPTRSSPPRSTGSLDNSNPTGDGSSTSSRRQRLQPSSGGATSPSRP